MVKVYNQAYKNDAGVIGERQVMAAYTDHPRGIYASWLITRSDYTIYNNLATKLLK